MSFQANLFRLRGMGSGLLLVAGLLLMAGCGGSPKSSQNPIDVYRLNGIEYGVLDKGSLDFSDTRISGKGTLIFKDPAKSDDNNYALTFSLEEGGSLTLVANSDAKLAEGVRYTFSRTGSRLKVVLSAGASETYDVSETFAAVPASSLPLMEIDVHGHGHSIVWAAGNKLDEFAFTTRVTGRLWGLRLDKATVTQAKIGKAKEEH